MPVELAPRITARRAAKLGDVHPLAEIVIIFFLCLLALAMVPPPLEDYRSSMTVVVDGP